MAIPRNITAKRSIVYYIGRALAMVGVVSMAWAAFYGAQFAYDMDNAQEESRYWRLHSGDATFVILRPPRDVMMTEEKTRDMWVLAQLSWASLLTGGFLMLLGGGRLMPQRMENQSVGSVDNAISQ